jgi:hypothetical protein
MLGQPGTVMLRVDPRKVLFRGVTGFSAPTSTAVSTTTLSRTENWARLMIAAV